MISKLSRYKKFFSNKKILITGHTGFKGSWLAFLLKMCNAKILGISNSFFSECSFSNVTEIKAINSRILDLREYDAIKNEITKFKPHFIFHLAAQPLVSHSYENPIETYSTNIFGTINLLEVVKKLKSLQGIIIITSDKCYAPKNYYLKEKDELFGIDPYSSSKSCQEIITWSYKKCFLQNIPLATARSGNVIGGGDYSKDRLITDLYNSIKNDTDIILRNPSNIRPWIFVLDTLRGYLDLMIALNKNLIKYSEPWNFSLNKGDQISVNKLVNIIVRKYKMNNKIIRMNKIGVKESELLFLSNEKSKKILKWEPWLNINEAIDYTMEWYLAYLGGKNMNKFSEKQIINYFKH